MPLSILLLTAAPSCAQDEPAYRGRYVTGFETSAFTPCAAAHEGERWWLVADSASYARLQDAAYGPGETVERRGRSAGAWVHVRGRITDPGRYGHVGGYDREIRVTEVLEAPASEPEDCP